jgi:Mg/Co/Ni transporter MgtE
LWTASLKYLQTPNNLGIAWSKAYQPSVVCTEMRIMTDLDLQDPAAKADSMVNPAFLAASMIEERAPDIVEALNDMPPELAAAVLLRLPPDRAVEVLDQPGLEREPELITPMPRDAAAKLFAGMSADRVADIFRQVKEPHRSELLDLLDPDTKVNIRRLLEYPKDTAGSIMTTEFASVPSTNTVEQTLDYIRHVESSRETVYAIYVLDPLSKKLGMRYHKCLASSSNNCVCIRLYVCCHCCTWFADRWRVGTPRKL